MYSSPSNLHQAIAYHRAGDYERAEGEYRNVIVQEPRNPEVVYYLGAVLLARGRVGEAIEEFRRAIELRPGYVEAMNNLGVALARAERFDEAVDTLHQALDIRPDWNELLSNQGGILRAQGRLDEAADCYRRIVELNPSAPESHNLYGTVLAVAGRLQEAVAHFKEALRLRPAYQTAHSNLLMARGHDPSVGPQMLFTEHRFFDLLHGPGMSLAPAHHTDRTPDRRLRIGYVSPDFRTHALAGLIEPVLAAHDRRAFEIFAYAEVAQPDDTSRRLQTHTDAWRTTVGQTDAQVAAQIQADRIDVLVDLAGHSAGNRLGVFTHKPAPVQVSFLGYTATTGLSTIDYRLTDAVCDPPSEPALHCEELVRLPAAFFCYQPPTDSPPVAPAPAIEHGHVTFGSLHKMPKLNPQVIDTWASILRTLPSARLLLFRNTLQGRIANDIRRRFVNQGIDADRLDFHHEKPADGFLSVFDQVDILLDTFPWSSHVMTCESLWMGVPIVTLRGDRHAGRMSASILTQLDMPDWIAADRQDYVNLAIQKASDIEALAKLRSKLRDRFSASPICDVQTYTANLEDKFRQMWRDYCSRDL